MISNVKSQDEFPGAIGAGIVSIGAVERRGAIEPAFYSDKDVARRLNLSPSWVRGQRHKRRHGLPHILDLDPRYIGTCARYVPSEVEAFIAATVGHGQ